jgi:DNA-binding NtrC family response regulator
LGAHVVLTDVRMPDIDGVSLLECLRERAPEVDVVLMTAYQDMSTVVRAMRLGAVEFLVKPIDLNVLLGVLRRTFEDRAIRRSAPSLDRSPVPIGHLVGSDPSMLAVFKLIGQAASSDKTVLIRGESGTGKELVARAIHTHSAIAQGPFVAVNCTAIPSNLLESELFGHVRGAFTGAVSSRQGRFNLAEGGTIFLDEIGDTSIEFQTKLLRVLQQREFYPVGADRAERTNARVITATHRDLDAMLADGRFREDLYYRMRVLEIALPPLRARRGDIEELAQHFLSRLSAAGDKKVISREALDDLRSYDWPGNVRELEHTLTRAAGRARGGVIRPDHLAIADPKATAPQKAKAPGALEDVEREHIRRVLELTNGNRTRAATILRVTAPRLRRLITRFGLDSHET